MKPLTIEQLKELQVGDWVWIIVLSFDGVNNPHKGDYYRIHPYLMDGELSCGWRGYTTAFKYSDYGDKWLAYKNKEQAEAKGEIVEVMEYNGFMPYLARDNFCGQPLLVVPISEKRNEEFKQQGVEDTDLCVFLE